MKNFLYSALILMAVAFTSCQKEEAPVVPATGSSTATPREITLDYHIYAASGKYNATLIAPNGDHFEITPISGNRIDQTFSFQSTSGNFFSVEASNSTPSSDEIVVEILVDGVLFKSGSANAPGAVAKAEGFVNN
ncbi:MAG: hypothetical protein ACOZCO_07865 [Bacteroidota bacterium]